MPYTPPAQLSPSLSKSNSPSVSRSQSFINNGQSLNTETPMVLQPPGLPRSNSSASYLNKHRRSPSLNDVRNAVLHNGEAYDGNQSFDPHGSVRQSPPPVNNSMIPTGMTISPPESSHNSSDDEEVRGRKRPIEEQNLKELQAAISVIQQRKEGSPNRNQEEKKVQMNGVPPSTPSQGVDSPRPPLSREARKITHSRSSTDSNIHFDNAPAPASTPTSRYEDSEDEDDSDEHRPNRPAMVRKKSGELVRPALRPSSRRRPSSMPGTPTYSKAVHFDSHLEHVRHFLQVDRPLAVSAGSSPVEAYESENEFPFGSDEASARPRAPAFEWEIRLANFPQQDTDERLAMPIRVERIFLSSDNKHLIGALAVQNLAFQKLVVCRFTLDYWKTTSEVVADFNNDVRRKGPSDGLDRFNFSIKLADQANLENKTLFFCVRYNVNGQEHWDSNTGFNYQVDFTKKVKTQHGKNGMPGLGARPLSALPRSRPSPPTSNNGRKTMPTSFDDFATGFESFGTYGQSAAALIGEPKIKLRSPRSKSELVPDAPVPRRHKSHGQAFGNRYDFNSSLNAAKSNAYAILGEQSGLPKLDTKQSSREVPAATAPKTVSIGLVKSQTGKGIVQAELAAKAPAVAPMVSTPATLLSEKPALASQSYQELVDKYCFFGTARSPQPLTKSALSMMDGSSEELSASDLSTASMRSSHSSGSSTPTPPRGMSPSPPSELSSAKAFSPNISRSTSPLPRTGSCYSSRSASPVSFGYPYHADTTLISGTPTPTAIRG